MNTGDFLNRLTTKELLQLSARVTNELRTRGICRSGNNPLSDYTEWLVASRLGLQLVENSAKGFDATCTRGQRYEIKARRLGAKNKSRQLSAIRSLELGLFHYLVAVIYSEDCDIQLALKIPHAVVVQNAKHNTHTNSYILHARDSLRNEDGVEDITAFLKA